LFLYPQNDEITSLRRDAKMEKNEKITPEKKETMETVASLCEKMVRGLPV